MATDFHNTGGVATKKVGVTSSLNIVHQYLVFQLYVPSGEPFSLELHVRDKHNVSKFFEKWPDRSNFCFCHFIFKILLKSFVFSPFLGKKETYVLRWYEEYSSKLDACTNS